VRVPKPTKQLVNAIRKDVMVPIAPNVATPTTTAVDRMLAEVEEF
jgi:hypothetical protein